VVDPESRTERGEREIGEVWVRGGNVARGYWNRAEDSELTFGAMLRPRSNAAAADEDGGREEGPFLRSGDLGFFHDGELYVAGRLKDLIILRGRNLYPQDLEACVERAHPALRPGCGAAFSIQLPSGEALVVAHEVRKESETDPREVIAAVRRALLREEGLRCHGVLLLRAGSIPKTSSGKIRRSACRDAFLDGTLEVVARDLQEVDEGATALLTLEQLLAYPPEGRRGALLESLRGALAEALDIAPDEIDMGVPLSESGIDSVAIMNLAHDIEARLSVELDFDLLLGGATPESIADHILDEVTSVLAPA
jgi:acyl carrier protein